MQLPIKVALHGGCGCASLQISSSELHARRDGHRHELLEQQLACVRHVHLHTPAHSVIMGWLGAEDTEAGSCQDYVHTPTSSRRLFIPWRGSVNEQRPCLGASKLEGFSNIQ